MANPVIDLVPTKDPVTGQEVWVEPEEPPSPGQVVLADRSGAMKLNEQSVVLPSERFSGLPEIQDPSSPVDWNAADQVRGGGKTVVISPAGDLVVSSDHGAPTDSVQLPNDRFASASPPEIGSWRDTSVPGAPPLPSAPPVAVTPGGQLQIASASQEHPGSVTLPSERFASGLGPSSAQRQESENRTVAALRDAHAKWIKQLTHTSRIPGMPAGAPIGWLYRPRPNRFGDQLVCVLAYHPGTLLYHAHYWRFEANLDGDGPKAIDLPRYLGRYPHLTHHKAHIYTGGDGTAVLCLSDRVSGGMPTLDTALVQTLKWADGTGDVVRGRPFPFR